MIKFEKIKPGMTLYDVRKATWRLPNNTWTVCVAQVDNDNRLVYASWNGNPYEWMNERRITKFRATRPSTPATR